MTIQKRARVLTAALASSLLLALSACGDEDVERNIDEGAQEVQDAGRDAKNAGEDAAKDAEKAGEDAADKVKEGANDLENELQE